MLTLGLAGQVWRSRSVSCMAAVPAPTPGELGQSPAPRRTHCHHSCVTVAEITHTIKQ